MIRYKDFTPRQTAKGGIFKAPTYEELSQTLATANAWIAEKQIKVINIETVVLPNMHNMGEEGSEDVQLHTSGEMGTYWYQFIRVWYQR